MDVYIDKSVHSKITDYYEAAMKNHITLDETTINRKICRIYEALEALGNYAYIYSLARLNQDWIDKEYREYIFEDIHFAYQIYERYDGTKIVRIHDVCHSLLYK